MGCSVLSFVINCPPSLRGDLSKWLCEINTGVYVGNVSSRVRDAIWDRVCENLKNGQATLVFNTNNEQRMDFRTHNTSWEAVDFEGIKLMRRPLPQTQAPAADLKPGFSNAAKRQMAQKMARKKAAAPAKEESYTVIDLETTGLNAASDAIVEYGALRVRDGQPAEEFSALVRGTEPLPDVVAKHAHVETFQILSPAHAGVDRKRKSIRSQVSNFSPPMRG